VPAVTDAVFAGAGEQVRRLPVDQDQRGDVGKVRFVGNGANKNMPTARRMKTVPSDGDTSFALSWLPMRASLRSFPGSVRCDGDLACVGPNGLRGLAPWAHVRCTAGGAS
jgi:hypothetical protein